MGGAETETTKAAYSHFSPAGKKNEEWGKRFGPEHFVAGAFGADSSDFSEELNGFFYPNEPLPL